MVVRSRTLSRSANWTKSASSRGSISSFGPGDFSHGIGCVGQFGDPRVVGRAAWRAAVRHGKFAGTVSSSALPSKLALGYRFLNVGADVLQLTNYFGRIAQAFKEVEREDPLSTR